MELQNRAIRGVFLLESISITDRGMKREINQDFVFESEEPIGKLPNLFVLADGMGGHKAGEYASQYSVSTFIDSIRKTTSDLPIAIIDKAIKDTNMAIVEKANSNEELKGMGTTFVVATICDDQLYVANVGDSRLYIIGNDIKQVTKDHSLVEEMVAEGKIERRDTRSHPNKHIITRAIGVNNEITPDFFEVTLREDEVILMCSDGLSNMLNDQEILDIVLNNIDDLDKVVEKLVDEANEHGGKDNISIIIVKL